jgi:surface antigen
LAPASPAPCACPAPQQTPASPLPNFTGHGNGHDLDDSDEIAALDAIRVTLSEVGDGNSYVWHRNNGRLSGVIHPTGSFRDASGRVCRHIVVVLTTGLHFGRIEGVACRLGDGSWQLEG